MSNSKVSYTAVLQAMSDGLAAYQVYLATCKMHPVRSEYLFYEPIARIAQSYGWRVQCEVDTGQKDKRVKGDKSRVDFVISPPGNGVGSPRLVIEVKYLRKSTKGKTIKSLDLKREQEKMRAEKFQGDRCALLIFGHGDAFGEEDELPKGMEVQEWLRGRTSIFELGNRKYAARYFYKRSECASANKIAEA